MNFAESTLVAVTGVVGSFGLWVLGQSDTVIPGEVTTLGTAAIGSGFLIWYARHVTSVLIPKLVESHETKVKEIIENNNRTLISITTEFRDETKQQRDDHERNINRVISLARPDFPASAVNPANR